MNGLEIVKMWNAVKGTKYPFTSNGSDSSVVRKMNSLIDSFGEDVITDYCNDKIKDNQDIWAIADSYKVKRWINERPQKVEGSNTDSLGGINILGLLSNELIKAMGTDLANNIGKEVEKKINEFVEDKVITKVIEYKGAQKKLNEITHSKFETIMKYVAMDEPVMLSGPAGTGKNVIAKQIADAMNLEFYFSNAVTQEYKLTGYGDANGNYVETQFYKWAKNGGLFLLDEMDASCPEALIVLNCAIANRYFDFPVVGRVELNENCRIMANANTYGTGATMEYVGRNQLDGATLNRFAIVEVDYDKRIEDNVCPDKDIADFCRAFRNVCNTNGVHHIISYREMSRLYKMIDIAKLDKEEAVKTGLLKGLEKDTLRMINEGLASSLVYKDVLKRIIEK